MYNRLLTIDPSISSSIFLFGPRGSGKTMWARASFPKAIYIDLLEFNYYKELSANPGRLAQFFPESFNDWIIIDEVQRIPELLNEIHRLIERYRFKFFLTGSSARSLKRKGVNLLAGRALRYYMHPLTQQELGKDFSLNHALQYGLLPATIGHTNPRRYLETYAQSYIREEVLQEGLTRNISAFSRFLEVASFSQGGVINTSEIAREVGVDRFVIHSYFDILEDLLIAYRLPPFAKRAKRRLTHHSKFYYFDAGVFRVLRPTGLLDTNKEMDGAGLETIFLQSLRAINDYLDLNYKIYFWRTSTGQEVDFIAYGPKGFHAFEIKRSTNVTGKSLSGLKAFQRDYPEAKLYLVYNGDHKEYHGEIAILPITEALSKLPSLLNPEV